jgi:hypothetical protein
MIHLASIIDHKAGGYLIENTTVANARLISAAPDLLAAVQYMIEHFGGHDEFYHATKALIAKATGGCNG